MKILPRTMALVLLASVARAQSGGFVTTLGADTVQVERFTRSPALWEGTIVQRTPAVRVIRWSLAFVDGKPTRYRAAATNAAGTPVLNGYSGTFAFSGDSIIREAYQRDTLVTSRLASRPGVYPSPGIPYLGVSALMYEAALAAARARGDSGIHQLTLISAQPAPSRTRAWFFGPDSAELDYFGRARSGWRFDRDGRLIRADWRNTTYRYLIERVESVDVDRTAAAWSAAETAGKGFGALSPRDSMIAAVDGKRVTVDYSRPSRRGRAIWGNVVPMDQVWRLGADVATHFTTESDLEIGGTRVPAGRYTLWMIPSDTAPKLVVSTAVNVFGTNYNPTRDLARIPLTRRLGVNVERLTISVADGLLAIAWGDATWTVPVRLAP